MRNGSGKPWTSLLSQEVARAKRLAVREGARVETRLRDALQTIEGYMKKHPRQAAAVTLSLGAVIGAAGTLSVRRKSRRRMRERP